MVYRMILTEVNTELSKSLSKKTSALELVQGELRTQKLVESVTTSHSERSHTPEGEDDEVDDDSHSEDDSVGAE
jgi:hypothetical protein